MPVHVVRLPDLAPSEELVKLGQGARDDLLWLPPGLPAPSSEPCPSRASRLK